MEVTELKLSQIEQNENSRMIYEKSDLGSLMASMKEHGLLEPIGVRQTARGAYEVVFGNRRMMAAEKLGWTKIPASVIKADEIKRDILNLVENIKRANITLTEEGRIYQMFLDRKLTESEISARVGVPTSHVRMALKCFHEIPEEFHSKIVNAARGSNLKKGNIPAGTARQVLQIKKSHNVNRKDLKELFTYASQDHSSIPKLRKIGQLLEGKMDVKSAIKQVEKMMNIQVVVLMKKAVIEKLEKKYGKGVNEILRDRLAEIPELDIEIFTRATETAEAA